MKKFCLLFFLSLCALKSFSQFEDDDNRVLNEFIVLLNPSHSIENVLHDFSSVKIKKCLSPRMKIYLIERNTTSSADDFLFALQQNENIKLAQFNHRVQPRALVPNDSFFNLQWNMLNTGQNGGIAGADIQATEAWDINHNNVTVTGDTLVVAVIDGKPYLAHEDLNFFTSYSEVPGNGIDDDGNGYIDDVNGWNVVDTSGNINGNDSHATHLAGIVGAKGNNAKGVAGVCWGVKILPIFYGNTDESNVVASYDYVREMRILYNNTFGTKGAFVVATNSSFGVNNGNPIDHPIWCAMYDSMGAVGILSAAATANANVDVDVAHDMPTECASKWLISATNTMRNDVKAIAGWGKTSIDLGAPGTAVYSTVSSNSYSIMNGTSQAAPHVAGAVAAMYAAACEGLINAYHAYPDSISLLIKKYLLDGAEWNSSLNTRTVTNGRLNLLRAFRNLKNFNCDSCSFNIEIDKIPISCKGVDDGAMAVLVDTGNIFDYQILWSNGITAPECLSMSPEFYTVRVTDTVAGCTRFASAELHYPDTIIISAINTIPATDSTSGNITIVASAGNETLLYSLDGTNYQQTATFSIPANGNYTVYVKNAEGCVVTQNVIVSDVDDLSITTYDLRIFPNPANDELTVYCPQFEGQKTLLEIFDVAGRKIYEVVPQSSIFNLQSSIFSHGIYFLKAGNITKKFAVIH